MKGYLRFKKWIHSDPLTVGDDSLTSYGRVELIALSIGLAMRELWINQFQEDVSNVPPHVTNSPVEFREYEQLSHAVKDLLAGYDEVYELSHVLQSGTHLWKLIAGLNKSTLCIQRTLLTGQ